MSQNNKSDVNVEKGIAKEGSLIVKVLSLSLFVVCFFVTTAIYTYIFARVQNSTIFFKFLDVVGMPSLSPILSFMWLLSLPIILICLFVVFKKILFKRIFQTQW